MVYGWYSFLIRCYSPAELNIKGDNLDGITFEVRQKIFHLFWIPFFGIGKIYALRKGGQLYNLTEEYVDLIKSYNNAKTPWYSYTGLLLIPLAYFIYLGMEMHDKYERVQSNKRFISEKLEKIDHPTSGDFYLLYSQEPYDTYIVKVEQFTQDSIQLKIPMVDYDRFLTSASSMDSYFKELVNNCRLEWVSKKELKSAIENDPRDLSNFEGVAIPIILDDIKFDIDRIERLE
jgi:hypothetical protein